MSKGWPKKFIIKHGSMQSRPYQVLSLSLVPVGVADVGTLSRRASKQSHDGASMAQTLDGAGMAQTLDGHASSKLGL